MVKGGTCGTIKELAHESLAMLVAVLSPSISVFIYTICMLYVYTVCVYVSIYVSYSMLSFSKELCLCMRVHTLLGQHHMLLNRQPSPALAPLGVAKWH